MTRRVDEQSEEEPSQGPLAATKSWVTAAPLALAAGFGPSAVSPPPKLRLAVSVLAILWLLVAEAVAAPPACAQATQAKKRAQAALSVATRKSNAAAARYRSCMMRQRNKRVRCAAEHKAFRKAGQHCDDMRAAYRFARDKATRACGKR